MPQLDFRPCEGVIVSQAKGKFPVRPCAGKAVGESDYCTKCQRRQRTHDAVRQLLVPGWQGLVPAAPAVVKRPSSARQKYRPPSKPRPEKRSTPEPEEVGGSAPAQRPGSRPDWMDRPTWLKGER